MPETRTDVPHAVDALNHVSGVPGRYNICMVSDFFFPGVGGVETHIYSLSQCLLKRGHKVIIVTRAREYIAKKSKQKCLRLGVRYMTNGLKVYYLPFPAYVAPSGVTSIPTLIGMFPIYRNIFIREQINIVHGHQCTSFMCLEAILHARTMGLKCCFTDHSLFGFSDSAGIHINKVIKFMLADVDHAISVSHTSKENIVLRAYLNPLKVSVIPHAVDSAMFRPKGYLNSGSGPSSPVSLSPHFSPSSDSLFSDKPSQNTSNQSQSHFGNFKDHNKTITIVTVTRIAYRKGADLLCAIIPPICKRFPHVNFVIGGDGPKTIDIEEMIERHNLYERVEMLGLVPHEDVRSVLVRGQIFINCSLTEAFCMAIVEAACAGLYVVTTKVGGVPEVLPSDMVTLAEPSPESLIDALSDAITDKIIKIDPILNHERISKLYNWNRVAERTEKVYDKLVQYPHRTLLQRLANYYSAGVIYGKIVCLIMTLDFLIYIFLEWLYPRDDIDIAPSTLILREVEDEDNGHHNHFVNPNS